MPGHRMEVLELAGSSPWLPASLRRGPLSCQRPRRRSPAVPLCLFPVFIDPLHAPLIVKLLTSFPGKDLISCARALCCPASTAGHSADAPGPAPAAQHPQCVGWLLEVPQLHAGPQPRTGMRTGMGTGWSPCLAGACLGRPVARSTCSRKRIDALNYLASERVVLVRRQHPVRRRGRRARLAPGAQEPKHTHGLEGADRHPAGVLWAPPGGTGHPAPLSVRCQVVPRRCHQHPRGVPSCWAGQGSQHPAEGPSGPSLFLGAPAGLPHWVGKH